MSNMTIDAVKARKLFKTATPDFKQELIEHFGEDTFRESILDKIDSFSDICKLAGTTEKKFYDECKKCGLHDHEIANRALEMATKVINQEWEPDFDNPDQKKWTPWFTGGASGFRFRFSDYDFTLAYPYLGARLCFKDKDSSDFMGENFTDFYKRLLIKM